MARSPAASAGLGGPWARREARARKLGAVVRFEVAHLEVAVAVVRARGVHAVLIGDDLRQ